MLSPFSLEFEGISAGLLGSIVLGALTVDLITIPVWISLILPLQDRVQLL